MFRLCFSFLLYQLLLLDVLSLYCYICSNCDETFNYTLTSEFVGSTDDLSCYKLVSRTSDYSEIVIRGYTRAKCSSSQIIDIWDYKQGFCCTTDYCNTTIKTNPSIPIVFFIFIILFSQK